MVKVTVILTSYNHVKYINEAIDSVLNQTFNDYELIIWDDCSSDGSWAVIQSYKDSRIKAYRNASQLCSGNINKALEVASGKYIAIHHSDDVWEINKLEKQVAFLDENSNVGAVFTNAAIISEESNIIDESEHLYGRAFVQKNRTRHEWLRYFFCNGNALCHPSVLIRRKCYDVCGVYRYGLAQLGDFDMWVRLCMEYEIHVLPEKLINFRVRKNEKNASGNSIEMRSRLYFEYYLIIQNYLSISLFSEIVSIFPNAIKYKSEKGENINFVWAMIFIEESDFALSKKLALELLFDLVNNPISSKFVLEVYDFDVVKFVELTKKYGIANKFVKEYESEIAGYESNITLRDVKIDELNEIISRKERHIGEIVGSRSWQITAPLRWPKFILRKFKVVAGSVISLVKQNGGTRNALMKVINIYRREKLSGVRRILLVIQGINLRTDYFKWVQQYDVLTDKRQTIIKQRIELLKQKPLISVVMPVYNPKLSWLKEAIESVQSQLYPRWELCIADDLSTDKDVRPLLEEFAKNDPRIKVVFREKNGHISSASNSALTLARGSWVALLDHDDLLPGHALFWVAEAINSCPNICMIYSDEDKIDEKNNRHGPYFKCDWNPDLFYSHNMFSHLGVYRLDLIKQVGGFRVGLEGAQDYDLALRCIEQVDATQIHHIPRVLYHWRVHKDSTAQSNDAKPYAMLAGEKALNEHFKRVGVDAKAEFLGCGYRTKYALPHKLPMVSIIIVTKNRLKQIRRCVDSVLNKTLYTNYEIVIIDNGSDDSKTLVYFESLSLESRVKIIKGDRLFNYFQLINSAVKKAKGDVVCLLSDDIKVITSEWLTEMVSHAVRPEIGAVGAKLWYEDDTLQHGGMLLGVSGVATHAHKHTLKESHGYFGRTKLISGFSAVTAACLVVRKEVYNQVGGLNECELKACYSDVDFCLRLRERGYRNIWTPYAELYNYESIKSPAKIAELGQGVLYMKDKWGGVLKNDPAYSPNLTLDYEDFSYAWPPRLN